MALNQVFKAKELIKPNLIQKILKIKPKQNSLIEFNNLLAKKEKIIELNDKEISDIVKNYRCKFWKKYKQELLQIYRDCIKHCLIDKHLSEEERADLKHFQMLFAIKNKIAKDILNEEIINIYHKEYNKIISDGEISEQEKTFLQDLESNFGLDEKFYTDTKDELIKDFYNNLFTNAISDQKLSPEEEQKLNVVAKNLGIDVSMSEATRETLEKYKLFWQIDNGEIPIINVPIYLQKNERCHFYSEIEWYENRTVTKRYNVGGPSLRIKIMKGVYYRVGSYDVRKVTDEVLKFIDSGEVYLTNKRILFVGNKKNSTIRLNRILDVTPYSNGIEITKDAGKTPMFIFDKNIDVFAVIISKLMEENSK